MKRSLILLIPSLLFAWHGDYQSKNQFNSDQTMSIIQQLELENEFRWGNLTANIAPKIKRDFIKKHDVEEMEFHEVYLSWQSNLLRLSLGKKIIIWGKSDEFNPADFISSEDNRYFMLLDKAQRAQASPLIELSYTQENSSWSMIFVPAPEKNTEPSQQSPWRSKMYRDLQQNSLVELHDDKETQIFPRDMQLALKYSRIFDWGDLDIMLSSGPSPVAYYPLSFNTQTMKYDVTPDYKRYQGLGIAAVHPFSSFTTRLEAAFRDQIYHPTASGYHKSNSFDLNLGIDWQGPDNLYINLQYIISQVGNYRSAVIRPEQIDFALLKIQDTIISDNLLWAIRAGIGVASNSGQVLNPYLTYTLWEQLELSGGAYLFSGSNNSGYFSQYNQNDLYYLDLKAHF